jgi:hypothetical protein
MEEPFRGRFPHPDFTIAVNCQLKHLLSFPALRVFASSVPVLRQTPEGVSAGYTLKTSPSHERYSTGGCMSRSLLVKILTFSKAESNSGVPNEHEQQTARAALICFSSFLISIFSLLCCFAQPVISMARVWRYGKKKKKKKKRKLTIQ